MKSFFISVLIGTVITMNLFSQNQGQITIRKEGRKTTYEKNGKLLNNMELAAALKLNDASRKEFRKSEALSTTGAVFVITGFVSTCTAVVFSGLSIITAINDNHDKSSQYLADAGIILLSGLGLMTVGCVFGVSSVHHKTTSINNFNNGLNTGRRDKATIIVGLTGKGVGMRIKF